MKHLLIGFGNYKSGYLFLTRRYQAKKIDSIFNLEDCNDEN